jgi:hypothetical protein
MSRGGVRKPLAKPRLHLKVYRGRDYHSTITCEEEEQDIKEKVEQFCSDYFSRERQRNSNQGGTA